jgi:hypothetical protein
MAQKNWLDAVKLSKFILRFLGLFMVSIIYHKIDLAVITVCNKRCAGLDLWEKTVRAQNFTPTILGVGDTRSLGHESKQFGLKFVLLAEHLVTLDPNQLCLVTDGFDVILHNTSQLLNNLQAIPKDKLIFAADVYENPDQGYPYKTKHLRIPYLNSGIYVGTAKTILTVLEPVFQMRNPFDLDDQRYFVQYMFKNPDSILIDHACQLFVCMAGLKRKRDYDIRNGILHVFDQSTPCVIHFQGFYKDTSWVKELYTDADIQFLAQKIHRNPSACQRQIGDAVHSLTTVLPVPQKYAFKTLCIVLFFLILIVLQVKS